MDELGFNSFSTYGRCGESYMPPEKYRQNEDVEAEIEDIEGHHLDPNNVLNANRKDREVDECYQFERLMSSWMLKWLNVTVMIVMSRSEQVNEFV